MASLKARFTGRALLNRYTKPYSKRLQRFFSKSPGTGAVMSKRAVPTRLIKAESALRTRLTKTQERNDVPVQDYDRDPKIVHWAST